MKAWRRTVSGLTAPDRRYDPPSGKGILALARCAIPIAPLSGALVPPGTNLPLSRLIILGRTLIRSLSAQASHASAFRNAVGSIAKQFLPNG